MQPEARKLSGQNELIKLSAQDPLYLYNPHTRLTDLVSCSGELSLPLWHRLDVQPIPIPSNHAGNCFPASLVTGHGHVSEFKTMKGGQKRIVISFHGQLNFT